MTIGNSRGINFGDLAKINQVNNITATGDSVDFSTTDFEVVNETNFPGLAIAIDSSDFMTYDAASGEGTALKNGVFELAFNFNFETTSQSAIVVLSLEAEPPEGGGFVRIKALSKSLSKAGTSQVPAVGYFSARQGGKWRISVFSFSNDANFKTIVNVSPSFTIPAFTTDIAFFQR